MKEAPINLKNIGSVGMINIWHIVVVSSNVNSVGSQESLIDREGLMWPRNEGMPVMLEIGQIRAEEVHPIEAILRIAKNNCR